VPHQPRRQPGFFDAASPGLPQRMLGASPTETAATTFFFVGSIVAAKDARCLTNRDVDNLIVGAVLYSRPQRMLGASPTETDRRRRREEVDDTSRKGCSVPHQPRQICDGAFCPF